jgi:hypothetical protein
MALRHSVALLLIAVSACTIGDEELYQALPESTDDGDNPRDASPLPPDGGDGGTGEPPADAGPDGGRDASLPPIFEQVTFNDRCDDEYRKVLTPGRTELILDTTEMNNDVSLSAGLSCVERGQDTPGNDGFIAVDMRFGDVWHIHMTPDEDEDRGGKDPAFYVLDSLCDVRKCNFGIDYCRAEEHEHFTFVAHNDGRHYLGIDDRTEGGGVYGLSATLVECGNGRNQHGKACDATNPEDKNRERCDNECRVQLPLSDNNQTFENGVHDDFTVANVVMFPEEGAPIVDIGGDIGGCTADYYTFTAQQGQSLKVTMLDEHGAACTGTSDRIALELRDAADNRLQTGASVESNSCPSLSRDELSEGRYYLKLADTLEAGLSEIVGYRLRVELSPP